MSSLPSPTTTQSDPSLLSVLCNWRHFRKKKKRERVWTVFLFLFVFWPWTFAPSFQGSTISLQAHRTAEVGGTSGDGLVQSPAQAGSPRAGCSGTCPIGF